MVRSRAVRIGKDKIEARGPFLSEEDGRAILERSAQKHLGIGAAEFIGRWNAGEYDDEIERPEVMRVAMLLPLASNYLSDEEIEQIIEEQAQETLHMSARTFIELWRAGKIENPDRPEVIDLLMLLPVAR